MPSLIESLVEVLQEQTEIYKDLLKQSQQKTEMIVKNDIEEIKISTEKEEGTIRKIAKLELKREDVIKQIAAVLKVSENQIKISDLIQVLEKAPTDQKLLQQTQTEMLEVLQELQKTNEKNKQLIKQSLDYIDFSVNLIQTSQNASTTSYNSGGMSRYGSATDQSYFDLKR